MPKRAKGLSAVGLDHLPLGRHADGGGLYAVISEKSRTWAFRYQRAGKRHEMGLGPMQSVSLATARKKAKAAAAQLEEGKDPIAARAEAEAEAAAPPPTPPTTFAEAVDDYIAQHAPTWRSEKTMAAWTNTLRNHAGPKLGKVPVADIGRDHMLDVLQVLWRENHETARKTRARIATVIDYAMAKGWRAEGLNPARWRGNLDKLLGKRPVDAATQHYAALPWDQMPAFMAALRQRHALVARMLEFTILTATRSNEARGARWQEVDLERGVWVVPASRTKGGAEHRVALSPAAVALLRNLPNLHGSSHDPEALMFPGPRGGPHSNMATAALLDRMQAGADDGKPRWRDTDGRAITTHGFRSTFRTWAGETTSHPREVVETALSHRVGDQVERAYARGDLFTRRARLMTDWAGFCTRKTADVVALSAPEGQRA